MATGLTLGQKHAILAVNKVHPAVSFAVRSQVTREALVRRGFAVEARVPLCVKPGLRLTEAGLKFARTGDET